MAQNLAITLQPGTLPAGFCFTSFQDYYNTIISLTTAFVPGTYNFFNYGNTEPAPEDRNKPWLRLFPDGSPDKWYVYYAGFWSWPNPTPASGMERRIVEAAASDIWSYDGGDGTDPSTNPPTGSTGAMWEEDLNYAAKFPVGAGTMPSTTVIGVGDTGGEEKHILIPTETALPSHYHQEAVATDAGQPQTYPFGSDASGTSTICQLTSGGNVRPRTSNEVAPTPIVPVVGHNTLPPYRGCRFIRRTSRIFYTPI